MQDVPGFCSVGHLLEHSPAHYSYKVSYFKNSYSACWLILSLIYVSSEWNSVWEIWWWYMLWNLSTMQLAKPYLPFFTANIELLRCFSPTGYMGQLLYGTHWWRLWEFRGYFWQGEMELNIFTCKMWISRLSRRVIEVSGNYSGT